MNNSTFGTMNISTNDQKTFSCNLRDTDLTRTLKIFGFFFFGGFGIVNNIFIIVLAAKYTVRKNLHHLIISMAVSDIFIVLTMLGLRILSMLISNAWFDVKIIGGDIVCKLLRVFATSSAGSSLITLLIISIERFRATRLQISRPYTLSKRVKELMCSWLVSFALASTRIPSISIQKVSSERGECINLERRFGLAIILYVTVLVMFSTIVILSTVTLRRLSNRQTIQDSLPNIQRQARAKRMANAIKMVLSSLFLYLCCYIPIVSWQAFKNFAKNIQNMHSIICYDSYVFEVIADFLPIVNSCFSPVIYLIFLSDFREAAKRLVCIRVRPLEMRANASQQERPQDVETITPRTCIALRKILKEKNQLETTGAYHLYKETGLLKSRKDIVPNGSFQTHAQKR